MAGAPGVGRYNLSDGADRELVRADNGVAFRGRAAASVGDVQELLDVKDRVADQGLVDAN